MRGLRPFLIILLATLLALGGALRMTPSATAMPACHAMAGSMAGHDGPPAPAHRSKSEAAAVNCCAGCLPAAVRDLAPVVRRAPAVALTFAVLSQAVEDLSLAPDPRPPRAAA